jgi:hypothetical protein
MSTQKAQEYYNTAIQVIGNARFTNFASTDDLITQLAWGNRAWLMGEEQLAMAIGELSSLLQKIDSRLDRLERQSRTMSR